MDSERRTAAIRRTVHGPVVPWFLEFAGIRGSGTYEQFRTGRCVYLSWVLRKPVP